MSQPAVNQTEIDGALGVLPETGGAAFALVGTCTGGTANVPAAFGRTKDLIAAFGRGPLVDAACYYIENYQRPVLVCKAPGSTPGAYVSTPTVTGAGTSAITDTAATVPEDDFEAYVVFDVGGTRGTTGIVYRYSLDGGRNMSAQVALGTGVVIAIPNSGVSFDLAAGTILAGQTISQRTTAPAPSAAEVGTALDALKANGIVWRTVHITSPIDGTTFDTIATKIADKRHDWVGNSRTPTAAESEATYLAAMVTIFSAKVSTYGVLCFGACDLTANGRKLRRPFGFAVAAAEASVSEEVDTADPNRGGLPGVSITDANGNNKHHDESLNPGADDARFCAARTWDDFTGVFINRPRLFSSAGSDFYISPMRRILNLVHKTAKLYMAKRLNQPLEVNPKTGYLRESEASDIELGCNAAFAAALAGKKTSATLAVSRTDNILSTHTLTGSYRDLPPAYIEQANLDGGFINPANVVTF